MLLGDIILLADIALQSGEDVTFMQEIFSTLTFDIKQFIISNAVGVGSSLSVLRRDREVFKFFSEDNDSLLGQKGVL